MSVVLETGAKMEELDGDWATQEPPFSNAEEQQSECHPVEPRCSTEALQTAIQANWGIPPDGIILIFTVIYDK